MLATLPPIMQILSRLALALALLVTGCDTGTCPEMIEGTTGQENTTGEVEPPPAAKMGDRCSINADCGGEPGLLCIGSPFNYCSRQCGSSFPDVDCSTGDHEFLGTIWKSYTCEVWPGEGLQLCTQHTTRE